ncbi:MAG TPA: hypothetical protein VHB77_07090 [Planctomycetaceae bacterium]|nr:hypothetical protein [Planctomycetaceae bacterium]
MLAVALEPHSTTRASLPAHQQTKWGLLCTIAMAGCLVIVIGYWLRTTNNTAAAYKAWHLAHAEYGDGHATLDAVCAASRRCCLAQCSVPRFSRALPLEEHLKRIDALRPTDGAPSDTESKPDHRAEIWRIYHDEAALWVRLGKPK